MKPAPSDHRATGTLSEATATSVNLCRCTRYIPIGEAVLEARAAYRKADNP